MQPWKWLRWLIVAFDVDLQENGKMVVLAFCELVQLYAQQPVI